VLSAVVLHFVARRHVDYGRVHSTMCPVGWPRPRQFPRRPRRAGLRPRHRRRLRYGGFATPLPRRTPTMTSV